MYILWVYLLSFTTIHRISFKRTSIQHLQALRSFWVHGRMLKATKYERVFVKSDKHSITKEAKASASYILKLWDTMPISSAQRLIFSYNVRSTFMIVWIIWFNNQKYMVIVSFDQNDRQYSNFLYCYIEIEALLLSLCIKANIIFIFVFIQILRIQKIQTEKVWYQLSKDVNHES